MRSRINIPSPPPLHQNTFLDEKFDVLTDQIWDRAALDEDAQLDVPVEGVSSFSSTECFMESWRKR